MTSGASVPEVLVRDVLAWLAERGYGEVEAVIAAEESLLFSLPNELRRDLKARKGEDAGERAPRRRVRGLRLAALSRRVRPRPRARGVPARDSLRQVGVVARVAAEVVGELGRAERARRDLEGRQRSAAASLVRCSSCIRRAVTSTRDSSVPTNLLYCSTDRASDWPIVVTWPPRVARRA